MTHQLNQRLLKLEARRRPAVVIVPKSERDALVRLHGAKEGKIEIGNMPNDFLAPNRAAAIAAGQRADT
jgi:hypothetical protein